MRRAVEFFIDRPLAVHLITLFVCIAGLVAATSTPRTLLPYVAKRWLRVRAVLPGASAIEMERLVTFRLEEALQGMEALEEIRSTTQNGRAQVWLKVKSSHGDMPAFKEEVTSRLSELSYRLPRALRPYRFAEFESFKPPFMFVYVENADPTNASHRRAVQLVEERLRRVADIIDVRSGLRDMELYVRFSRAALEQRRIDSTWVRQRIMERLAPMPVGKIDVGDQSITIELGKANEHLADLGSLPLVINRAGQGVRLRDLARIESGFGEDLERRTLNGESFVLLQPIPAKDADIIDLSREVRRLLDGELAAKLPDELALSVGLDTSDMISHEIETLAANGLLGVGLVLLVLFAFIGWRAGAMTALGLPFCYAGTVAVLWFAGFNFNTVTLLTMILMIGVLVDDGIIISEAFVSEVRGGAAPREAAIAAVSRVSRPVVAMAATSIIAFAPLLVIQEDVLSDILAPVPVVVATTLCFSLVESFFILPSHLVHVLGSGRGPPERAAVLTLRTAYRRLLGVLVRLRYVVILVVVGLAALAAYLLTAHVSIQVSDINVDPTTYVFVELEESPSLDFLAERVKRVEAVVEELPPELVDHYRTSLGAGFAGSSMLRGFKYAGIDISPSGNFVEADVRARELEPLLQERLDELEGFAKLYVVTKDRAETESRDVVRVFVSGKDRLAFYEIQEAIRRSLLPVRSVKHVYMDEARFQVGYRFDVNEAAVLAYGMTTSDLHAQLRENFSQRELVLLRMQGEEVSVVAGLDDTFRPSTASLSRLSVLGPRQTPIPLRYLGAWREVESLRYIQHRDVLRVFSVDVIYDANEVDAAAVAAAIDKNLESVRAAFPDYYVSVTPPRAERRARSWLTQILLLCLGFIYLSLALTLGRLGQPALVAVAIPFGFTGVIFALYAHGMPLDLFAAIGGLGLAGVVVNDSLVMATAINRGFQQAPGAGFRAAVLEGAASRLQAVVLTSLTTLGGVFPLAYGVAGQAGWFRSMVFALGWGVLFATVLTLFIFPCVLVVLEDLRRAGRRLFARAS